VKPLQSNAFPAKWASDRKIINHSLNDKVIWYERSAMVQPQEKLLDAHPSCSTISASFS